jgi:hypothetical protein
MTKNATGDSPVRLLTPEEIETHRLDMQTDGQMMRDLLKKQQQKPA